MVAEGAPSIEVGCWPDAGGTVPEGGPEWLPDVAPGKINAVEAREEPNTTLLPSSRLETAFGCRYPIGDGGGGAEPAL